MTHINSFIPPVSSPLRDTSPLLPSLQDPDTLRVSFPASGPLPIPMTNDYLFRALLQRNQRPRCKQRGIKIQAQASSLEAQDAKIQAQASSLEAQDAKIQAQINEIKLQAAEIDKLQAWIKAHGYDPADI